ncbi:type VI secretion protein [Streptomyces sp. NBC_01387]|uniref:type VI secretion protein n=1 Tax=Streptomyces sp. NBC_01387 TaxID=2903849 RepID=UPI0032463C94
MYSTQPHQPHQPDRRRPPPPPQPRGIPDGLLIGLIVLLLGLTLLVWLAAGLSGVLTHGAWPDSVSVAHTPVAIRQLASSPHDLGAAWPDTPPSQLPGYGLFWGLLVGELLILLVLTVFVVGTVTRWRALRTAQRTAAAEPAGPGSGSGSGPGPGSTEQFPAGQPVTGQFPVRHETPAGPDGTAAAGTSPAPAPAPVEFGAVEAEAVEATALGAVAPVPARTPTVADPPPELSDRGIHFGPAESRRNAAVQAVRDAAGPALVVTSSPSVWAETKDARAKLGPVLVYDPGHVCDTPARLHWSPTSGCEDMETAAARAVALLAPVRPQARIDATMADTAETLLQSWLHAAAIDGRPFKQVHRWAQGAGSAHEPVRILRTHSKASSGAAGLLESALTAHPERRDVAQQLTVRALSALSTVHIRETCTPNRTDTVTLESFIHEGGTLYLVGEAIEDPRTRPGAMPLLTALASHVVGHGRRLAARSTDGRLDPPMALVLDDIAAVAPLPQLPELLATGREQGLHALALLRSPEQAHSRWPHLDRA